MKLKNKKTINAVRHHCKGDPELPVHRQQLVEKARMLMARGGMGDRQAGALIDHLLALVDDDKLDNEQIMNIVG